MDALNAQKHHRNCWGSGEPFLSCPLQIFRACSGIHKGTFVKFYLTENVKRNLPFLHTSLYIYTGIKEKRKKAFSLYTLCSGVAVKATKTFKTLWALATHWTVYKNIQLECRKLILLPSGSTAHCGWMSVGYLANTALNIHYNNGGEVEAGGQDATGCVSNHPGYRNVAVIYTHKCQHTQRTGHWLKIQHYN